MPLSNEPNTVEQYRLFFTVDITLNCRFYFWMAAEAFHL